MLIISLRQFQLKANFYLKQLPLTLTVYGKPVAIVNTFSDSVNTSSDNLMGGEIPQKISTMPGTTPKNKEGWCELHFERGVKYPLQLVTWEDENGNPIINKKMACPKCIEQYTYLGKGKLYIL